MNSFLKPSIVTLKKLLSESDVEQPTVELQLLSLTLFMGALDYLPKNPMATTFVYNGTDKCFPKELSWINAITLFNIGYFKIKDEKYVVPRSCSTYCVRWCFSLKSAKASSPLENIYLQWNKRKKCWQVTTNIIKFNKEYFNE